jgi:hypothetical protein
MSKRQALMAGRPDGVVVDAISFASVRSFGVFS